MFEFPVFICLVGMVLWVLVWRRLAGNPPIVWTRRTFLSLSLAVLCALAVPLLVVIGLRLL